MKSHAYVAIIGGGAVGASILYHLTEAGVADCLLIEKDELTSGSTWHAAGNIPTYANTWLGMRAGNYAWELYKGLGARLNTPITYRHTGAFWPAHTNRRMDFYRHIVGVARSAGFDLAMITPGDMEELHPWYRAGGGVIGGLYDPYEGDIDPGQLTQALVRAARNGGAHIARFTEVTAISRVPSGAWLLETTAGQVQAEILVNAAGFYGDKVARMAGSYAPMATLEHQYVVTEPLADLAGDKTLFPLVRDPDIRFYLRREGAGFLLGSYAHEGRLAFDGGLPDGFAYGLFPDRLDDMAPVIEAALGHIPLLAEAGIKRFVNGPIAYAPDAQPLCGAAAGIPNLYHACGIQVGITQSAAVGKAMAEWITEGETEWDLSAWDPRRFGPWADEAFTRQRVVELYHLQYAIAYPHRLLASGRPLQRTPIYATLGGKGAQFGAIGGWERAMWFNRDFDGGGAAYDEGCLSLRDDEPWRAAVRQECVSVRDTVGVMDHGGFSKYEVSGAGAAAFLSRVFTGTIPHEGRVKLSYMLTHKGMIWGEATICCLGEGRFLLCGPTLAAERDYDWLKRFCPDDGSVTLRQGFALDAALMVMGPASRDLLSRLTDADLSAESMPWMSAQNLTIAGVHVLALRVSYVGELGWELHLRSHDLPHLYQNLTEAGADFGLTDFGSYALNAMRIEKGYHGWGADFGVEYTLHDAGLMRFANLDKGDFIGRAATIKGAETPPSWEFAGFVIESPDADPMAGDPIICDGRLVGYVTSGGEGFRIGKRLALGYIEGGLRERVFDIEILGRPCRAERASLPFYDPDNRRLKS